MAADEVRKDRKKAVKNDSVVRLAAVLHVDGKEGVEAQWEKTPEFHEAWKAKARDLLAKAEWRRRKLTARLKASHFSLFSPETLASRSHTATGHKSLGLLAKAEWRRRNLSARLKASALPRP